MVDKPSARNAADRVAGPISRPAISPIARQFPVVSVITSETCAGQIAIGYLRNIYAVHSKASGCPADAIYVYTHDSSGNVPPLRVLSGPATKLDEPVGIYEGQ